jgi:hypothetical protein
MNIKEIIQTARSHGQSLPDETRQSYPIPVRDGESLRLVFLYSNGVLKPGTGQILYAPNYRAVIDAKSGKFETLQTTSSQQLGVSHDDTKPIGTVKAPAELTPQETLSKQQRLYHLYDALLPAYASGREEGNSQTQELAKEFRQIFNLLSEEPLRAYYKAVGADFFGWLEKVITGPKP